MTLPIIKEASKEIERMEIDISEMLYASEINKLKMIKIIAKTLLIFLKIYILKNFY